MARKKPNGYWNYDNCFTAAKDCNTRTEFSKKYPSAYNIASKNKWLDDYIWFETTQKPSCYWEIYENNYEVAKKCKTRKEFANKYNSAYNAARRCGYLSKYLWFEEPHKPSGYWNNYEHCYCAARKCKTKEEFKKKYSSAMKYARKNGWLQYYVWFENRLSPYNNKIDNVYVYFFEKGHAVYVGRSIRPKERDLQHRVDKKDVIFKYSQKENIEIPKMTILEQNLTLEDGLIYEELYVEQYRNDGWKILNKGCLGIYSGSVGRAKSIYTKSYCKKIAEKCKNVKEMNDYYGRAYHVALKNGWVDEFFPNRRKVRPINQYDLNGNLVNTFQNAAEVQKKLGFCSPSIRECCKGNQKYSYGYVWRYAE